MLSSTLNTHDVAVPRETPPQRELGLLTLDQPPYKHRALVVVFCLSRRGLFTERTTFVRRYDTLDEAGIVRIRAVADRCGGGIGHLDWLGRGGPIWRDRAAGLRLAALADRCRRGFTLLVNRGEYDTISGDCAVKVFFETSEG